MEAVTAALEGEAVDWVMALYSQNTRKLADASLLLETLQDCFEDVTRAQLAKGDLMLLNQGT